MPPPALIDLKETADNRTIISPEHVVSLKTGHPPREESILAAAARLLPNAEVQNLRCIVSNGEDLQLRTNLAFIRLSNRICNDPNCGKKNVLRELRLCEGCKSTWYCNADCQLRDWEKHSAWCGNPDARVDDGPLAFVAVPVAPPSPAGTPPSP